MNNKEIQNYFAKLDTEDLLVCYNNILLNNNNKKDFYKMSEEYVQLCYRELVKRGILEVNNDSFDNTLPHGLKSTNEHIKNTKSSYVCYNDDSGNKYEGEWKDDEPNGQVVMTTEDGTQYRQTWQDGELITIILIFLRWLYRYVTTL